MYTDHNFKTKKALKDAVLARQLLTHARDHVQPHEGYAATSLIFNRALAAIPRLSYHQPGPFGGNEVSNGTIYLEGPHYPAPHTWYAQAQVRDGEIVKVTA